MPGKSTIIGFNALRAFSVLLVISSHVGINGLSSHPAWVTFFRVFDANYGVRTFFILSGFLITTILIKEHVETGRISIPYFIVKRALRILPLYFLALAFVFVLASLGLAQWKSMPFWYSLLFVFNYVPQRANINYMSHLWSLSVEEQFYILWPLLFAVLIRTRRALLAVCVTIIALCYWRSGVDVGELAKTYYPGRWTIPAIYPILIGCTLAILISYGKPVAIVFGSRLALLVSLGLISLPFFYRVWPVHIPFLGAIGIGGIIAWIYLNQANRMVRNLDWGIIGYLGVISYGLYMWQGIFTGNGGYRSFPGWPPDVWTGAVITFIVAPLSFHFYESWFIAQKHRFEYLAGLRFPHPTRPAQLP